MKIEIVKFKNSSPIDWFSHVFRLKYYKTPLEAHEITTSNEIGQCEQLKKSYMQNEKNCQWGPTNPKLKLD